MPKRKQPAQLKLRNAAGELLTRRKRWFSHGEDKQAATDKAKVLEAHEGVVDADAHARAESEFDWYANEERSDYLMDNRDYDRWIDEFVDSLEWAAAGRTLLDAAPAALRDQWLARQPRSTGHIDRGHLEARIALPWDSASSLKSQVQKYVTPGSDLLAISEVCAQTNKTYCARLILYFAPLWIRDPQTFHGTSLRELLDHLFVKYDVPECLYSAWTHPQWGNSPDYKWMGWFICFAQGASLFKLGQCADGWSVAKGFQHHFAKRNKHESVFTAVMCAELDRLGIDAAIQTYLTGHRYYQMDPTSEWFQADTTRGKHWRDTALWLNRHADVLNYDDAMLILNWSNWWVGMDQSFSWSGRTLNATLRHAIEYDQSKHNPFVKWPSHNMDWSDDNDWRVLELCSSSQLEQEGHALQHCVGSYGWLCVQGQSAVFSLRHQETPVVTIEIDPRNGVIKQARGMNNRACSVAETNLIQRWLLATMPSDEL